MLKKLKNAPTVGGRRRICRLLSSSSSDDHGTAGDVAVETDDQRTSVAQFQSPAAPTVASPERSQPSQQLSLLSRCLKKLPAKQTVNSLVTSAFANTSSGSATPSFSNTTSATATATMEQDTSNFTLNIGFDSDDEDDGEKEEGCASQQRGASRTWGESCVPESASTFMVDRTRSSQQADGGSQKTSGSGVLARAGAVGLSKEERLRLSRLKQQQFREKMAAKKQRQMQGKQQQQQQKEQQQRHPAVSLISSASSSPG